MFLPSRLLWEDIAVEEGDFDFVELGSFSCRVGCWVVDSAMVGFVVVALRLVAGGLNSFFCGMGSSVISSATVAAVAVSFVAE